MKQLTVFLDIDGVLLDYSKKKPLALWADNSLEFIRFLNEQANIRIIWSTCWFRAFSPKKRFGIYFGKIHTTPREHFEWFFENKGQTKYSIDPDEFYSEIDKLFEKAVYIYWDYSKTELISCLKGNNYFLFVDDGLVKRELDVLAKSNQIDKWFRVDLTKKDKNLIAAKKHIENLLAV